MNQKIIFVKLTKEENEGWSLVNRVIKEEEGRIFDFEKKMT